MRNSYGADWGMQGHFWLPYPYALDPKLAGDFWTLRLKP
jgi:C1A family cysteine protease